jgi:hypothetical protein
MGCHTWIYKKANKEDCIRLIHGCITSAKDAINPVYSDIFKVDKEEADIQMDEYFSDLKEGRFTHDPDHVFYYMKDGRWIPCNELTDKDSLEAHKSVIEDCQKALDTLDTVDELKKFILDNSRYYGYFFNDDTEWGIDRYISMLYNDEIYVNSDRIQAEAFKYCDQFRVYGYPCDESDEFYRTSPAGCRVEGWDNADDLIGFLEWFKTTDAGSHKPTINGIDSEYGEEFYNVIRKFFEVNKGKNLLVNFS